MSEELRPRFDEETPEGAARALVWAMTNLLPWHVPHPRAGQHVFLSSDEMAKVWMAHGGALGAMPKVAFDHRMVVAVFMAEGSYKTVLGVARVVHHAGKVWIVVSQSSRPWSMMNPACVISVPRIEAEAVFVDDASPEALALVSAVGP
jgi:hypothetical protein